MKPNKEDIKIAILISGTGSIMEAILRFFLRKNLWCRAILSPNNFVVIANKQSSGLEKARAFEVRAIVIESKNKTREDFESILHAKLIEEKVSFIALAGFMRILTANFVSMWSGRVINSHPSLLPSFKGAHAVQDALNYGVKIVGTTIHFVSPEVDGGKIIAQLSTPVKPQDEEIALHEKIKKLERKLYPKVLYNLLCRT